MTASLKFFSLWPTVSDAILILETASVILIVIGAFASIE